MSAVLRKYNKLPVSVKASIWFLICTFLQKGILIITTPIFTRLMSAAEYGTFNVFTSWQSIISVIVTLNLSAGVYNRGLVAFEEKRNRFSSAMQGLNLLLCCLGVLVYLIFEKKINGLLGLTKVQMLGMFLLMWTTAVFNFWAANQRVVYKYKGLVAITLLVSVLRPMAGVFFVVSFDDKVTARIISIMLVELIFYAWMFFWQMFEGKVFFDAYFWKHALKFNIPLIPHYLSQMALNGADRIMIQAIVSDEAAGIYSLAYSLGVVMTLFHTALMQTISPWMYTKIKKNRINDLAPVAYGTLLLIALVNIILIAFAPEIVMLFAPREYYAAIWCIPPIAMSVYFVYSYDLFAKIGFYYEKTKVISVATAVVAVLNIALNYICIKEFGYIAAAYTTLVCYMLYSLFHYFAMKWICKKECNNNQPYDVGVLLKITFGFLALGFVYLISYTNNIARYGLTAVILVLLLIQKRRIHAILWSIINTKKYEESED